MNTPSIVDGWELDDPEWMKDYEVDEPDRASEPEPEFDIEPETTNKDPYPDIEKSNNARLGITHPNAILNDEDAIDVYLRAWSGNEDHASIASDYGITTMQVSHIKHGRRWGWLTENIGRD